MKFRNLAVAVTLIAAGAIAIPTAAFAHSNGDSHWRDHDEHDDGHSRDHDRDDEGSFRSPPFGFDFPEVRVGDLPRVPHDPAADGGSNAHGRALIVRFFNKVIVVLHVDGAAPGLPHAQHFHGTALNRCPGPERDVDHDGLINTSEGAPDYGPIVVSLTTTGDTSPASGLAVDRFPVANANGSYTYVRQFTVGVDFPAEIAKNLSGTHIVTHGIDTNHNGMYDFSAGVSDLDPSLPQEATVPAACGTHDRLH